MSEHRVRSLLAEAAGLMQDMDPWARKRILDWVYRTWPNTFEALDRPRGHVLAPTDHESMFDDDAAVHGVAQMEALEALHRRKILEGAIPPKPEDPDEGDS